MKRKEFLKKAMAAGFMPFVMEGMNMQVYAHTPVLKAIAKAAAQNGRVFVFIQLNGGNDGLNTIIPTAEYSNLSQARSNILIQENKVLSLNGITGTGLHPAMTGLRNLFNEGKVNIIQSVGYPDPNYSHFRSTDIWHTASDSSQFLSSGWLGRYLQDVYTGFPEGYPNPDDPDPLAISIGYNVSTTLMGPTANTGVAINDPKTFYDLVNGTVDQAPNTPAGHELTYIRRVLQQTQEYNVVVKNAALSVTNKATYPANNTLADQLKIVANLIAGGLRTPVYTVQITGFDTHASQVNTTGGTDAGLHADLLKKVSDAIAAFQSDCEQLGIADRVAGMTYSEFGRRIKSNFSLGTDHGAAAPMIVFGTQVNPIIIGSNPSIPASVSVNDNLPMQYDFRQVYATILADWFEVPVSKINSDYLFKQFAPLPIFKQSVSARPLEIPLSAMASLEQNYPNPFTDLTQITYSTPGGETELLVFDFKGKLVQTLVHGKQPQGRYTVTLEGYNFPSGNYYCQLITPAGRLTRSLIKV